ncbi:hypothetical protein EVA_00514 [gut metagenome]|uniref:Uncharacterized protein n=1 Tax=gut metagenome TaxID=749906 RepID=J9GQY1_9ZZZZ
MASLADTDGKLPVECPQEKGTGTTCLCRSPFEKILANPVENNLSAGISTGLYFLVGDCFVDQSLFSFVNCVFLRVNCIF